MTAICHVYTASRAAKILGVDEDLIWELSYRLGPENGGLWILDDTEDGVLGSRNMASKPCANASKSTMMPKELARRTDDFRGPRRMGIYHVSVSAWDAQVRNILAAISQKSEMLHSHCAQL